MKTLSTTIKQARALLKEISSAGVTIKIQNLNRKHTEHDELVVSSPTDFGPACATLFFTKDGRFGEAAVFEPGRCRHCLDEGLTMDQALDESMRYVDAIEDVCNFLQRKPYQWDGKKEWLKRITKA